MMTKVLIIDDENDNRKLIKLILKRVGCSFDITEVSTGKEAIEKLSSSFFDLIFLDILLPDISGTEIIKYINKNSKVIVITALEDINIKNEKDLSLKIIYKPIKIDKLIELIKKTLKDEVC